MPSNNNNNNQGTLLDQYIRALQGQSNTYTPMTDAEIQDAARNRYQGVYDQRRLDARQEHEAGTLARQQQRVSTNETFDEQVRASNKNYQNQQVQTMRNAVGTGMQRSSFTGATVANIGVKGAEAENAINRQRSTALGNIDAEQALAERNLAAQIAQLNQSQQSDMLAYQDELSQREYDRRMAASDRAIQIAGDIFAAQQYATEHGLFGLGKQPTVSYGGGYSSGGRGYIPPPGGNDDDPYDDMNDRLGGGSSGDRTRANRARNTRRDSAI